MTRTVKWYRIRFVRGSIARDRAMKMTVNFSDQMDSRMIEFQVIQNRIYSRYTRE